MRAKIAKWGNSTGVRIPKPLLEVVGLSDNDTVEIIAENKTLVIKPARERLTLEKIFDGTNQNAPDAYDWGEPDAPAGKELL
jgi:antitoxin MazE